MSNSQSHVRNACDACHKRKIRCHMPSEGGSCLNCLSKGLRCYFLPRHKSGRPRMNGRSSMDTGYQNSLTMMPPESATGAHSGIADAHLSWMSHQDLINESEDPPSKRNYSPPDFNQYLSESISSDNALLDAQHTSLPSLHSLDFPLLSPENDALSDTSAPSHLDPSNGITSTASQPALNSTSSFRIEPAREATFANLLKQCTKLQDHLISIDENNCNMSDKKNRSSSGQSKRILDDIDASCKFMLEICDQDMLSEASNQSKQPDAALLSLTITLALKVFQVCDALLSGQAFTLTCMKDLLLHKRLDFNITQARIATQRIEELTRDKMLSKELWKMALHVHKRFASSSKA
ncbi:hypothetical protein QQS21_001901 [Conoideocrella luteorostrata]|uniref:Zn(2)-C6 fungal-type domain-containing protein n=1 Tax=Conoideocrella luteorostrata TaxID=1105319 RepID=A0AAJ0D009_9HYPO|nr:hypothetical protein QQS21_001901 [Conoideocrella luteorostrata]